MDQLTLGMSNFALKRHLPGTGFSYSSYTSQDLVALTSAMWDSRLPGHGEKDLSRKVAVPLGRLDNFYCPPTIPLRATHLLKTEAIARQPGEDPIVEVYLAIDDARTMGFVPIPAFQVEAVCYSAEALLENNGERTTDTDWEIVALLCHGEEKEKMSSVTMARNYLQKAGGTFTEYTAQQFAEAIYDEHTRRNIKVKGNIIGWLPPVPYFPGDKQPSLGWFEWYYRIMEVWFPASEKRKYAKVLLETT
jgi:hypothetical protein